jgi:hydrogenase maturation protease
VSDARPRILLFGFGNPGRLDDGLGPALAARFETCPETNLTVDADYQLTVEDAAQVAEHDVVIFADAAVRGTAPFYFRRIRPEAEISFSTHSVSPAAVVALAQQMFGGRAAAFVLGIRGYEFNEFGERLSARARAHLADAEAFLRTAVRENRFTEIGCESGAALCGADGRSAEGA